MSNYVSGRKKLASSSSDMSVYKSSDEGSVRYKRSKESSVYKSSDELFEYSCDPCSSAGEHLEAEGFCTDCGEYLCGTCFRSHSRGKATKHHKLLNKDVMPRKSVQTCDPCKTADEEVDAVGYCLECEEKLCNDCLRSHSRNKATKRHILIDKDEIPEESESAVTSSISKIDIKKGDSGYQSYTEKYTYVRKIKVKTSWREKKTSYINAMTMVSDTELVLMDFNNKSIKLFDTERNIKTDTLVLKASPAGLTTVPEGQVAVTLLDLNAIQIITVAENLSVQRNIEVSGMCLGIAFLNRKLYASYYQPVKFQVLQPSGAVYKEINPDSEIQKHCTTPCNIAVSPDESVIYVSDWETKNILSIDMDGNMITIYQGVLDIPFDIAISPFGSIYLCDRGDGVVYKMSLDLKEAFVILGPENLGSPFAMCFSAANQHLYISNGRAEVKESNYIKVFKWQ